MKQKPDETPDEWVRQMLNRLPDAPPPGSSFDSARLWNQLRPELQAKPARRQSWWWLSAACVIGLVVGWLVWPLSRREAKTGSTTPIATYRPKAGANAKHSPEQTETMPDPSPALAETPQSKRQRNVVPHQPLPRPGNAATAPIAPKPELVTRASELPPTLVAETLAVSRKANVVTKAPKRRFRIMHENELRAEDEAAPQLYQINHFVRLGAGHRSDDEPSANGQHTTNGSENRSPALTMPLNN